MIIRLSRVFRKMAPCTACCLVMVAVLMCSCGCDESASVISVSTHRKLGWRASDYFTDPSVVALCDEIEQNDIAAVGQLIASGVDVNARGKGNMTPLLWGFLDNHSVVFRKLLEAGADPNVRFESDFNSNGLFRAGESVTFLAATSRFKEQFFDVMKHGGEPGFCSRKPMTSLVHAVIRSSAPDRAKRLKVLIDLKADLDVVDYMDSTPAMAAAMNGAQYDLAIMLIRAGADWRVYQERNNGKLIHFVVKEELFSRVLVDTQQEAYAELLEFLVEQGESAEDARRDLRRWEELYRYSTIEEIGRERLREREERLKKEKERKGAAENGDAQGLDVAKPSNE